MLKEYRLSHKLTQQQMADLLEIDFTCYSRYENHQRKMPYKVLIKFLELRKEKYDDYVISVLEQI